MFAIEDLFFNCIFIRANQHLVEIAKSLRIDLPEDLLDNMKKTEAALEELWDPITNQYYSRNFVSHELLKEPTIAALMPIYAGVVSKEKAEKIIKSLENKHLYGPTYPIPSIPVNSAWFFDKNYWQGATWINTNWMLIDGLERMGYKDHAEALTEATIELVGRSDMNEYFSSINGEPAGINHFSWTAALTIDLLEKQKK
jgi:glycogen debranching enzyme